MFLRVRAKNISIVTLYRSAVTVTVTASINRLLQEMLYMHRCYVIGCYKYLAAAGMQYHLLKYYKINEKVNL